MKLYTTYLCLVIVCAFSSCKMRATKNAALKQGISGNVTVSEGNQMPGPDQPEKKHRGVVRNIFIYAVATAATVEGKGPLYSVINRPLIAKIRTDTSGSFSCALKPGTYSIFTQEENGQFFSSLSNDKGEIGPVKILPNQVLSYNIQVNYNAVY